MAHTSSTENPDQGYAYQGKMVYSIYVKGVETARGKLDNSSPMATGQWVVEPNDLPQRQRSRTVTGRTDDAIKQIVARIDAFAKRYPDQQVDELIFDVFGFSRGLACARHFVNRLAKGKVKDLQNAINDKLKGAAKLKLRFLGICDTVAAILPDLFDVANSVHDGDTGKEVHITTDFSFIEKVTHLTAIDEARYPNP